MSLLRVLGKRLALGLAAAWTVLTSVFLLFTLTDDWVLDGIEGQLRWAGEDEAVIEAVRQEYLAARGLDRPLHEQYAAWMADMLTLQWGESFASGEAVLPLVAEAVARTATYVVPAVAIAVVVGLSVGLYAALRPGSRLAGSGVGSAYLLFALPNFWVGGMALSVVGRDGIAHGALVFDHVLPVVLTASTLLGGYVAYSRAHGLEYSTADFVTLVEAKGGGPLRVAGHVVRNAAIPFVSMLFTEALGLLVLAVFVIETLFGIEGFGLLLFDAVQQRDLPVLLGGTIVVIAVGVAGNVVQDLSYGALDPRVDTGSR